MRAALILIIMLIPTLTAAASTPDLYDEGLVRDLKLYFSQPNWWDLLYQNMNDKICIEADLVVDGVTYPQVGVRFKGASSASVWPAEKMPFKIKTDEFVAGQDLYGYDSISLSNSYLDPTFTRETVTYHILRKYMPAPKSNFVRLWLNDEYWGIYVNSQQISGEFVDEWFKDDTGNRYKCDAPGGGGLGNSTLIWLGSNPASYYDNYQLKSEPNGTEWLDLINMIDVLNNRPVTVHWTELAPILNIDRCLWYMAGANLFCNLDSYILAGHNYYLYNDPYEGYFNPITWDTNMAFGNFSLGMPVTMLQQLSPLYNYGQYNYPLITKLLDPVAGLRGRPVYLAHFRDMLLQEWDWTKIGGLVQQYQDLIEQDVIDDTKKLYSMQDFYDNVTQDLSLGPYVSCGLQPFVENRRAYLLGLPEINAACPAISGATTYPLQPSDGEDIYFLADVTVAGAVLDTVSACYRTAAGTLYTELAMYDDGQHKDGAAGDSLFGGMIPGQPGGTTVQYFILASTTDDTVSLEPVFGESAPLSVIVQPLSGGNGVLINEFVAKNDSGYQDEMGEFEDWIELFNTTGSTIDLGGVHLTDDVADLTKWQIPAGTNIDAGETLLIWADNDPGDGPLHAEFKLDTDGEEIYLVDTDGSTVLDSIVFGPQEADISTGRLFDGDVPWVTFIEPSADQVNAPGTTGYRAFSALDSTVHPMALEGVGAPLINTTVTFELRNGPLSSIVVLPVSVFPDYKPFAQLDTVLLVQSPFALLLTLATDGTGAFDLNIPLPNDQGLVGIPIYSQILTNANGFIEASNGLEMIIGM